MLDILKRGNLLFPTIIYLDEKLIKIGNEKRFFHICKLDWSYSDKKKKEDYEKWLKNHNEGIHRYYGDLPEEYDKYVKEQKFLLNGTYLHEIKRTATQGYIEWATERHFDTSIREMCLKPAQSFIEVSFKLLADCIYDEKTQYFSRDEKRYILDNMMLYKFWQHQTGRGLVKFYAEIDELEDQINSDFYRNIYGQNRIIETKKFIDELNKYEEYVDSMYQQNIDIQLDIQNPKN